MRFVALILAATLLAAFPAQAASAPDEDGGASVEISAAPGTAGDVALPDSRRLTKSASEPARARRKALPIPRIHRTLRPPADPVGWPGPRHRVYAAHAVVTAPPPSPEDSPLPH